MVYGDPAGSNVTERDPQTPVFNAERRSKWPESPKPTFRTATGPPNRLMLASLPRTGDGSPGDADDGVATKCADNRSSIVLALDSSVSSTDVTAANGPAKLFFGRAYV